MDLNLSTIRWSWLTNFTKMHCLTRGSRPNTSITCHCLVVRYNIFITQWLSCLTFRFVDLICTFFIPVTIVTFEKIKLITLLTKCQYVTVGCDYLLFSLTYQSIPNCVMSFVALAEQYPIKRYSCPPPDPCHLILRKSH